MCISVTKVGQGHPKLLLVQRLYGPTRPTPPNMKFMCNEPTLYRPLKCGRHFVQLPKLRVTLYPYISERVSHTKKVTWVQTCLAFDYKVQCSDSM